MKVSFHALPSSLRQLPNATLNKPTTGCHFVYPIGIDKVLAESQRAGTHQGDPQMCTKICYESNRAGFRSSDRRQYSGSLLRGLGAISLIITGSPRLSSSGRRKRPIRHGCKVKFSGRQRAGVGIKLSSFKTSTLDGISDNPTPQLPDTRESSLVPVVQQAGWTLGQVWIGVERRESLARTGTPLAYLLVISSSTSRKIP